MTKLATTAKRFGGFMKRNAMYFLIVLTIASVASVIALAVTGTFGADTAPVLLPDDGTDTPVVNPDDGTPVVKPDDDTPVVKPEPLTFCSPVNGELTREYSETVLAWNSTLGEYSAHLGTDFVSKDLAVFSVASGTVKETGYDALDGYYVTITHPESYESRYYSLAETLNVKVGDTVIEGQQIGTMSDSMTRECLDGNHLHFEMSKGGTDINPLEVLILEEK